MVPFQNAVYFCRRGSLPRGGQSLAWEAQNYRFSSQSETSYEATLLPRSNGVITGQEDSD